MPEYHLEVSVTEKCKETLKAIQREEMDDPFGWIIPVAK